jgi:hypothetical protein
MKLHIINNIKDVLEDLGEIFDKEFMNTCTPSPKKTPHTLVPPTTS